MVVTIVHVTYKLTLSMQPLDHKTNKCIDLLNIVAITYFRRTS